MKKIAFILGSMSRGGAERVISILSKYYANKGYQTDILMLLKNEVGYELHPSTRLFDLSGSTESRIKRVPHWLKSIKNYVKENKPDVVVSFAARINVLVLLALKGTKTKVIVSERNDPKLDGRSKLVRFMTDTLYPKATKVVFQTKRASSYYKKLKNAVIIPNPVSLTAKRSEVDNNKIVSVGRLEPQKNHALLINAFYEHSKVYPSAYLQIYGEGGKREELNALIESLELQDKVFLMGNVSDVIDKIKDAAVFCLPSNYEGLSNALLEAMTLGIPCVSTRCAGADEYIVDGENGFLVEVGNVNEFAVKIMKLFGDNELKNKFSIGIKESAKAFNMETVMQAWDGVIEE